MGFKSLSNNLPTFVDTLATHGYIDRRVFDITLSSDWTKNDTDSRIIFGSTDFSSDNYTLQVTNTGYWSVEMENATYDGKSLNIESTVAILDTGTSFLAINSYDFDTLSDRIIGEKIKDCGETYEGLIYCNCSSKSEFSTISVSMGGHTFDIPPRSYVHEREVDDTNVCFVLIEPIDFKLPDGSFVWILGDVFLREYRVLYDMDSMTVSMEKESAGSSLSAWTVLAVIWAFST